MITIHPEAEDKIRDEHNFELFRHEGLLCCVQRVSFFGTINGYVAVEEDHPFFGKHYNDKVHCKEDPKFNGNYIGLLLTVMGEDSDYQLGIYPISMAINVHGGLTYSKDNLSGINDDVFGKLWWFGFDTSHAGDIHPYQTDIDREFPIDRGKYRDFEYVKEQTIKLANQLKTHGTNN